MGTEVTPSREILFIEETDFKSGVVESTIQKISAVSNHIVKYQYDTHKWDANGRFSLFTINEGFDGKYPVLFDMEIVGYALGVKTTGISGTSTFDIHRYTGGDTDAGSIFSTRPAVVNTAADDTQSIIRLDPASDLQLPTGHTKGIFSLTELNAGDALEARIDAAADGGRNATIALMFRPR